MASRKVPVIVTYSSPGAQPPIFLAGSFSEWEPVEMEYAVEDNNEYQFHKEVMVEAGGHFQYKFRIGHGDWWGLNEDAPTGTDDLGNRNNILIAPIAEEPSRSTLTTESESAYNGVPEVNVAGNRSDSEPHLNTTATDYKHLQAIREDAKAGTPDIANAAAEVADSAATIDREPSPALLTDEEAGRTGQRRLSFTPIPEVAKTAAEVADVAAIIDRLNDKAHMAFHRSSLSDAAGLGSGTVTPANERAPLFAHECVEPHTGRAEEHSPDLDHARSISPYEQELVFDPHDPTIEDFPLDRSAILTHIRSTESRLGQDETDFENSSSLPAVGASVSSSNDEETSPVLKNARSSSSIGKSPSLNIIAEEHTENEAGIVERGVSGIQNGSHLEGELPSGVKIQVDEVTNEVSDAQSKDPSPTSHFEKSSSANLGNGFKSSISTNGNPSPDGTHTVEADAKSKLADIGPEVVIEPATPGAAGHTLKDDSFLKAVNNKAMDTAESTSVVDGGSNGNGKLHMRNAAQIARSKTPDALQHQSRDKDAPRSLFEAIWRTIFVGWIGGLITRICGGRRRPLVTVSAIVLITIAPALYFFRL